jgi:hypothetical protein
LNALGAGFSQWLIDEQDEHWNLAGRSPGADLPALGLGLLLPLQHLPLVLGLHIGLLLGIDLRRLHELSVCWLRIASAQTADADWQQSEGDQRPKTGAENAHDWLLSTRENSPISVIKQRHQAKDEAPPAENGAKLGRRL